MSGFHTELKAGDSVTIGEMHRIVITECRGGSCRLNITSPFQIKVEKPERKDDEKKAQHVVKGYYDNRN